MTLPNTPPAIVDFGTGFLKAGLAGEEAPRFVQPSVVAYHEPAGSSKPLADLDYSIGHEALATGATAAGGLCYPMKGGLVADFDAWERVMTSLIHKHLRIFPEDHAFVLTEPPLNTPENREICAEIM
jgi:actin-related protein 3